MSNAYSYTFSTAALSMGPLDVEVVALDEAGNEARHAHQIQVGPGSPKRLVVDVDEVVQPEGAVEAVAFEAALLDAYGNAVELDADAVEWFVTPETGGLFEGNVLHPSGRVGTYTITARYAGPPLLTATASFAVVGAVTALPPEVERGEELTFSYRLPDSTRTARVELVDPESGDVLQTISLSKAIDPATQLATWTGSGSVSEAGALDVRVVFDDAAGQSLTLEQGRLDVLPTPGFSVVHLVVALGLLVPTVGVAGFGLVRRNRLAKKGGGA